MPPVPPLPALTLAALVVFGLLSVAIAVVDVRRHRIPDALLAPGYAASLILLTAAAITAQTPRSLGTAVAGGAAWFGVCLMLHARSPPSFGGGDVKLAGLAGLHLGWFGVEAAVCGLVVAFLAGGAAASGAVLAGTRNRAIAFGPFLLLGTWWCLLAGPP